MPHRPPCSATCCTTVALLLTVLLTVLMVGTGHAEPPLRFYGTLDTGIAWTRLAGAVSQTELVGGGQTDALWGLRGQEAIDPHSHIAFALEGGMDVTRGSAEDPERLFDSQAWLEWGQRKLGQWRLGRQATVGAAFVADIEVAGWKDFGMGALMRAADNYRVSHQISWRSPIWQGVQTGFSYSPDRGEQGAGGSRTRLYSVAMRYEHGPWLMVASAERSARLGGPEVGGQGGGPESGRHPAAWQAGISHAWSGSRMAAGWSQMRNGFVGLNGEAGPQAFLDGGRLHVVYLGLAMALGQGELQLQGSHARPDWRWQDTGTGTGKGTGHNQRARKIRVVSAGYVHPLSSRTRVYAFAAQGQRYAPATAVSADGTHAPRSARLAMGLTHHF